MRRAYAAFVLSLAVVTDVASGFSTPSLFGGAVPRLRQVTSGGSSCRRPSLGAMSKVSMVGTQGQSIEGLVQKVRDAAGKPAAKAPNRLFKAMRKPTGAPTIALEFARGEGVPLHKIDEISLTMRRDKACMIVVDTSVDQDGEKDVLAFVKEQSTAKSEFPGSVGIVWRGGINSVEDIAKAAATGCQGVAISVTSSGDKIAELIHACHTLGLEAVVEVGFLLYLPS